MSERRPPTRAERVLFRLFLAGAGVVLFVIDGQGVVDSLIGKAPTPGGQPASVVQSPPSSPVVTPSPSPSPTALEESQRRAQESRAELERQRERIRTLPTLDPNVYNGYDLDCEDFGREVYITGSDPHGLDGDGDGIGCEGW